MNSAEILSSAKVNAAREAARRPSEKYGGSEVPFSILLAASSPGTVSVKLPRRFAECRVQFYEPAPGTTAAVFSEISSDGAAGNIGANGIPCAVYDPAQFQDSAKSLVIKDTEYIYYNITMSAPGLLWINCYLSGKTGSETEAASRTIVR
jgi:hypothetical protein